MSEIVGEYKEEQKTTKNDKNNETNSLRPNCSNRPLPFNCPPGRKIQLYKNFRSRDNILDFTNFIFQDIMSEELGEVDYNKNEYLNFGAEDYKKIDQNLKTEIDIINTKPDDLEEGQTENDSQKNNHIEENIIGDYQNYIVDRENAESIEAGERRIRIH